MTFDTISLRKEEHIATITLNRPRRLNAMNEKMWAEMIQALDEVDRDEEMKVLVLTGAGRAFCSGADLRGDEESEQMVGRATPAEMRMGLGYGPQKVVRRLQQMQKPSIAMVNGDAVGAGFDWALSCDIRIGSEKARFMVAFTRLALVPATGGAWLLSRTIGRAKAAEYIFTADFISAAEAERMGILNRVVPQNRLVEETMALARRLAKNPPISLSLCKMLLDKAQETNLDTALEMAAICQGICVSTQDHKEGLAAFREKREPVFQGR